MAVIHDYSAEILSNLPVADGIYEMTLGVENLGPVLGGQFVDLLLPAKEHVLRRPLCICDYDLTSDTVTVCYAVVGQGTRLLSQMCAGQSLQALMPLGNGYIPKPEHKTIALIGGGMGAAVLPAVVRANPQCTFDAYMGFSDKSKVVLEDRMRGLCRDVVVATDNGSYGESGFVTEVFRNTLADKSYDAVFCCGPEPMFRALGRVTDAAGLPLYVSLEQRMGCGIGACLVCNCKVRRNGAEGYVRVCKDGPVFDWKEIVL